MSGYLSSSVTGAPLSLPITRPFCFAEEDPLSRATTLMSLRTLKVLPRHVMVDPRSTAHVQMGNARNSRPSQVGSHSRNGILSDPCAPLAKAGVSSSTSIVSSLCNLRYTARSHAAQMPTPSAQPAAVAPHVRGIPKIVLKNGSVVAA